MISLLSDFDSSTDEFLKSMLFVKSVELLKYAYGWDNRSVIFGEMWQKMKDPAKYWVYSLGDVFINWSQFTYKFLLDFPYVHNLNDAAITRYIVNGMDDTTSYIEFCIVPNEMIQANVLIGRDLLCHKRKRKIIEGDQRWVQNINAIEPQVGSTYVETEQLKRI